MLCATACYMRAVGVRELRQRASELLDDVEATGDSIEITNHGRPVARLVPITRTAGGTYAELLAQGWIRPGRGDPLGVEPVTPSAGGHNTDELLAADRDERGVNRPA
jgi:prevent-host-death family protein